MEGILVIPASLPLLQALKLHSSFLSFAFPCHLPREHSSLLFHRRSPIRSEKTMPRTAFSSSSSCPRIDVAVDMGNPFLNRTVDGFLKIGAVAASRVAAEEAFHFLQKGSISNGNLKDSLKGMCKEGAYWGTVAGVYVGVEYGIERVRGTKDWKNAMLGGAITGLLISATSNHNKEKVFKDAITAGAVATAAEFINYLT